MPMRLSRYLLEARKLGFNVIDVYRYREKEVLRGIYRGKVVLVELPRYRDSMDLETFKKELQSRLQA
ncbi:MAG: hypothetical protein QXY36_03075 [Sulfolobales archaeon]